jgi:hypothetical protein
LLRKTTILLIVVSVLALFYPLPLHEFHLRPVEPVVIIQGNYLLATNEPYYPEPTITYADILGKDPSCPIRLQCKYYAKTRIPSLPTGNANTIPVNSNTPIVGGAVLFYSNPYGHIAVVEKIFGDMIFISEQNQIGCGKISFRWISINSPSIKGYFNP